MYKQYLTVLRQKTVIAVSGTMGIFQSSLMPIGFCSLGLVVESEQQETGIKTLRLEGIKNRVCLPFPAISMLSSAGCR